MKNIITLLIVFVLVLAGCSPAGMPVLSTPTIPVVTYYVSTSGNDNNPGTESLPWRTIQKAANTLTAGQTVLVRGGVYDVPNNGSEIVLRNSGTPTQYITFKAYPGERVTIQGNYPQSGDSVWYGIRASGKSYIIIDGFTIKGFHAAVTCQAPGHHFIVRNVTAAWNSEVGISSVNGTGGSACDYLTIENNIVHNNGYYERGQPAVKRMEGGGSGISVNGQSSPYVFNSDFSHIHSFIRNNVIYHNFDGNGGSLMNTSTHTDGNGIIIDLGGAFPPIEISNNVIYDSGGRCIHMFGVSNIWVKNNTCYKNAWDTQVRSPSGYGEITAWCASGKCPSNIHVTGNIAWSLSNRKVTFFPDGGISELVNNVWYGSTPAPLGTSYKVIDPQFVDAAGGDFRLRSGSPACGFGALACDAVATATNTVMPPTATRTATRTPTATPTRTPTYTPTADVSKCDPDYLPDVCIYKVQ